MRLLSEGERRVIIHLQSLIIGKMCYMCTIDNISELEKTTDSMIGILNCIKAVLTIRLNERGGMNG